MTKNRNTPLKGASRELDPIPNFDLKKIGIVARNYCVTFPNGHRDFSYALLSVLELLDEKGCDSVLFSLFGIISRKGYSPIASFKDLKYIKVIFLEKFTDGKNREAGSYVVYYKTPTEWKEYSFSQVFGTLYGLRKADIASFERNKAQSIVETFVQNFVSMKLPKRTLGNCCVLLCGETNGIKYSKADKEIHDIYGLREAIPKRANIILNPIHDRMTRFEMKLKRKYLSENDRYVISVWNKGKQDKNGKIKDWCDPAWTIYYNKKEISIKQIPNKIGVEVGILDCKKA